MEIQKPQIEEMPTIPQSSNSQENVLKKTATASEIQAWLKESYETGDLVVALDMVAKMAVKEVSGMAGYQAL
ncbi:MAG: hypothetical protein AAGE59_39100, partial [Cyanobacteria bacterium P01_F01_bin.86]